MELKSKISTSIEQSKKLLEWGLKQETADMHYHKYRPGGYKLRLRPRITRENSVLYKRNKMQGGEKYADEYFEKTVGNNVPSWSLSRLLELMPNSIEYEPHYCAYLNIIPGNFAVSYIGFDEYERFYDCSNNSNDLFGNIISMIEWLIKNNYLNKDYLNK